MAEHYQGGPCNEFGRVMMEAKGIWIDHAGGPCPINLATRVYVRFEDGVENLSSVPSPAGFWDGIGGAHSNWERRDGCTGIIAYCVVQS